MRHISSASPERHLQRLVDHERLDAFRRAVGMAVMADQHVVLLGAGTGELAFLAARRGARVTAVESDAATARTCMRLLAANGVGAAVQVVRADPARWLPDEPADVLVCDCLHGALLREPQVALLSGFREAHLARFGRSPRLLPEAAVLAIQPVRQNFDFAGYHAPVAHYQPAYAAQERCVELGEPMLYAMVDFDCADTGEIGLDVRCILLEPGPVNAIRFITKAILAIDTAAPAVVDWYSPHLVLPLPVPLRLPAFARVRVRGAYRPGMDIDAFAAALEVTEV